MRYSALTLIESRLRIQAIKEVDLQESSLEVVGMEKITPGTREFFPSKVGPELSRAVRTGRRGFEADTIDISRALSFGR